jgi:hypothetical protein
MRQAQLTLKVFVVVCKDDEKLIVLGHTLMQCGTKRRRRGGGGGKSENPMQCTHAT